MVPIPASAKYFKYRAFFPNRDSPSLLFALDVEADRRRRTGNSRSSVPALSKDPPTSAFFLLVPT
jgi:hypothetical protein